MASRYICKRWAVLLNSVKPSLEQLCKAVAAVQPEEHSRLMKFVFFDDFMLSLVGRLMMRKLVAELTGIPYYAVKFARDKNGKPYWVAPEDKQHIQLQFNVSHQNNLVVLSGLVVHDQQTQPFGIGVDVSQTDYSKAKHWENYFYLMRRVFSSHEWDHINRCTQGVNAKLQAFARLWALKEAYSKVQGSGLFENFGRLSFNLHSDQCSISNNAPLMDTEVFVDNELQTNYKFEEHFLPHDYCVAIAFRDVQVPPAPFEYLDFNELIVDCDLPTMPFIEDYCRRVLAKENKINGLYT